MLSHETGYYGMKIIIPERGLHLELGHKYPTESTRTSIYVSRETIFRLLPMDLTKGQSVGQINSHNLWREVRTRQPH